MRELAARVLATWGGLGDLLPAPGTTVGSLLACLLFLLGSRVGIAPSPAALAATATALILPAAVWACSVESRRRASPDPGAIVIDETAGQFLALAVVLALRPGQGPTLGLVAVSFALFRACDILKPGPIRAAERLPGGWGIVADDLLAGVLAGAVHAAVIGVVPL